MWGGQVIEHQVGHGRGGIPDSRAQYLPDAFHAHTFGSNDMLWNMRAVWTSLVAVGSASRPQRIRGGVGKLSP